MIPTACGGGFGGKLDASVQLLGVAAWKLGRPVRCTFTRPESMAATTKRHPARMRARAACRKDGTLTAFEFHGDFDTGAYASWGPTVASRVPIHAAGPTPCRTSKQQPRRAHQCGAVRSVPWVRRAAMRHRA